MTQSTFRMLLFLILLTFNVCPSVGNGIWFNQRVTWKYGKEGLAWKTTIKLASGHAEYELALQPLWAVEGGVTALEIVVARPQEPDVNLLGERQNGIAYPFVTTVEELERGLARSEYGTVRKLQVDDIALDVKSSTSGLEKA